MGEWATATMGRGKGTDITLLREIRFPHSVGLLYSAFTAFLGFEVNEGEYKMMGMAPYGTPRYVDEVHKLIRVDNDGSFWLDMDYFCFHHSSHQTYKPKFLELFGEPRDPSWHFFTESSGYPSYFEPKPANYSELAKKNEYYADVAASIQQVTEEIVLAMARRLHAETGGDALCLGGRCGVEQRGERAGATGDALQATVHPAGGRRRRWGARRGPVHVARAASLPTRGGPT